MRPWSITINNQQLRTSDDRVYLFSTRKKAEDTARMCYTPVLRGNSYCKIVRYRDCGSKLFCRI